MMIKYLFLLFFLQLSAVIKITGLNNLSLRPKIEEAIQDLDEKNEIIKAVFQLAAFDNVVVEKTSYGWHVHVVERKFISSIKFLVQDEFGNFSEFEVLEKVANMQAKIIYSNSYLNYQSLIQAKSNIKQYYLRQGFLYINVHEEWKLLENGAYELIIKVIPRKKINNTKIKFIGLQSFKSSELENICSKRNKAFLYIVNLFVPETVEIMKDSASIKEYAYKKGFFDFYIEAAFVETFIDSQIIYFVIKEGNQAVIEKISVDSNFIVDVDFKKMVASEYNIQKLINQIKKDYKNKYGIILNIDYLLKKFANNYELILKIKEVKPNLIKKIIVKGNDNTLASVIINVAKLYQGIYITFEDLLSIPQYLKAIETIEDVKIVPKSSILNEVNYLDFDVVEIHVVEKSKGQIGLKAHSMFNSISELKENILDNSGIDIFYKNFSFLGQNKKFLFNFSVLNSNVKFEFMNSVPRFLNKNMELVFKTSITNEYPNKITSYVDYNRWFSYFDKNKIKGYKVFQIEQSAIVSTQLNDFITCDFGLQLNYMKIKKDLAKFKIIQNDNLFPYSSLNLPKFFNELNFYYKGFVGKINFSIPVKINNGNFYDINSYLKINFLLKWHYDFNYLGLFLRTFSSGGVIFNRAVESGIIDNFESIKIKGFNIIGLYEVANETNYKDSSKTHEIFKEIGGSKYFAQTFELVLPLQDKFLNLPKWFKFNSFYGVYCGSLWNSGLNEKNIKEYNLKGDEKFMLRVSHAFGFRFNFSIIKIEIARVFYLNKHNDDKTYNYIFNVGLGSIEI